MIETKAENISNFMNWAGARIAKEAAKNEKLAEEIGPSFYDLEQPLRKMDWEDDMKLELVNDVQDLMQEDQLSVTAACVKSDIHPKTFRLWRKYFQNKGDLT